MGGGRGFTYYNVFKKWLKQKCDLWQIAQELCGRGSHACSGLENTKVCKNCVCGAQSLHSRCVISVRGGKQRVPISPMARRYCPGPLNVSSPGSTRWRWWWAPRVVSVLTMIFIDKKSCYNKIFDNDWIYFSLLLHILCVKGRVQIIKMEI